MAASQWSVQQAKNRLSEVLRAAQSGRAQIVTKRGKPTAVVLSFEDYQRLRTAANEPKPTFIDMLLAIPKGDLDLDPVIVEPRDVDL